MRITIVYPGPLFSVRDVALGYHIALAIQGHEVTVVDMAKRLHIFERVTKYGFPELEDHPDPDMRNRVSIRMASENAVIECLRHEPDVVLVVSCMYINPDIFPLLRRAGFPTAALFTESPYDDEAQLIIAAETDCCFITERTSLPAFRRVNPNSHYLGHAYDPDVHRPILTRPGDALDVFLVGTGFQRRVRMLEAVNWEGLDFRLFGQWSLGDDSPLQSRYQGNDRLPNFVVPRWYSRAAISINLHRQDAGWGLLDGELGEKVTGVWSINPRAYEIAACGGFQICDDSRGELAEVFGDSVPTFTNAAELEELVRYYVRSPQARRDLADQARERVKDHTFAQRAQAVASELRALVA